MIETRRERTGWRDHRISERHCPWGVDYPGVDIDFVLVDSNHGAPQGIVECKHEKAGAQDPEHLSMREARAFAGRLRSDRPTCAIANAVLAPCERSVPMRGIPASNLAAAIAVTSPPRGCS